MVCLLVLHACSAPPPLSPHDDILPNINGVKTGPYLFGAGVCFPMQGDIAHALLHPLKARTHGRNYKLPSALLKPNSLKPSTLQFQP